MWGYRWPVSANYSDPYLCFSCSFIPFNTVLELQFGAVFTISVDCDQLKYNPGNHTPFNFIQLWFCSCLQKFKYNRQGNLAV